MKHNLLKFNFKEIIFRNTIIDSYQFENDVDSIAKQITIKTIINKSPFVYLMSDNTYKAAVYYFAIIKAGKIAVLIDPDTTDFELSDFFETVPPAAIICPDNTGIRPELDTDSFIYTSDTAVINTEELDNVCTMMFTNAEDGHMKAVKITFDNIESSIKSCEYIDTFTKDCVLCAMLPFYHIFGLMSGPIYGTRSGGKLIIYEMAKVLDTSTMIQSFIDHGLTNLYSVPMVHYLISKSALGEELGKVLKSAVAGGYKLDKSISDAFVKRTGVKLREGYGLTESTGITFGHRMKKDPLKQDSVGRASSELQTKIVDDFGNEVPQGIIGEVTLSGKGVIDGFYNNNHATEEFIKNGWLLTGDEGFFDEEGYLFLTGLKKRMLNVAGKNVYPAELERFISKNKLVKHCAIYGEYSGIFGHKVIAEVELKKPTNENEAILKQWCKTNLSSYKLPKRWEFKQSTDNHPLGQYSEMIKETIK